MNHAGQEQESNGPTKTILSCGIRTNPLIFPTYGLDSEDPPKRAGDGVFAKYPHATRNGKCTLCLFSFAGYHATCCGELHPKTKVRSNRGVRLIRVVAESKVKLAWVEFALQLPCLAFRLTLEHGVPCIVRSRMSTPTLTKKGQTTISNDIQKRLNLHPGA
jgi:hypothetical protein